MIRLPYVDGLSFCPAVPLDRISNRASNHNVWDLAKLSRFAQAIREHGFTSAVLLRELAPDVFEIVDGEHRCRAARTAGLTAVPALVFTAGACPDPEATARHIGHNAYRGSMDLTAVARQLEQAGRLDGLELLAGYDSVGIDELVRALKVPDIAEIETADMLISLDLAPPRRPATAAQVQKPARPVGLDTFLLANLAGGGMVRMTDDPAGAGVRLLRYPKAGLLERVGLSGYERCYLLSQTAEAVLVVTTKRRKGQPALVVTKAGREAGCT